jgi:hypothetical protein
MNQNQKDNAQDRLMSQLKREVNKTRIISSELKNTTLRMSIKLGQKSVMAGMILGIFYWLIQLYLKTGSYTILSMAFIVSTAVTISGIQIYREFPSKVIIDDKKILVENKKVTYKVTDIKKKQNKIENTVNKSNTLEKMVKEFGYYDKISTYNGMTYIGIIKSYKDELLIIQTVNGDITILRDNIMVQEVIK